MSYDPKFMSLLGPTSGAMVWSYFSPTDTLAQLKATTYFTSIWRQLDPGDRIHCHANGQLFDLAVVSSTASAVTVVASLPYA